MTACLPVKLLTKSSRRGRAALVVTTAGSPTHADPALALQQTSDLSAGPAFGSAKIASGIIRVGTRIDSLAHHARGKQRVVRPRQSGDRRGHRRTA